MPCPSRLRFTPVLPGPPAPVSPLCARRSGDVLLRTSFCPHCPWASQVGSMPPCISMPTCTWLLKAPLHPMQTRRAPVHRRAQMHSARPAPRIAAPAGGAQVLLQLGRPTRARSSRTRRSCAQVGLDCSLRLSRLVSLSHVKAPVLRPCFGQLVVYQQHCHLKGLLVYRRVSRLSFPHLLSAFSATESDPWVTRMVVHPFCAGPRGFRAF